MLHKYVRLQLGVPIFYRSVVYGFIYLTCLDASLIANENLEMKMILKLILKNRVRGCGLNLYLLFMALRVGISLSVH